MQNLVIAASDTDFLEKASRALVRTGHRFLARCKEPDTALELVESRQQSREPVRVLLGSIPTDDPLAKKFLRELRKKFPNVAVLLVEEDNASEVAIDVFAAPDNWTPDSVAIPLDVRGLGALIDEAVARFSEQRSQAAAIDEFWKKLQAYAGSPDLVEHFFREVLSFLDVKRGSIFLYDEKRARMVLIAASDDGEQDLVGLTKNIGEGVAGYVAEQRKPLLVISREASPLPLTESPRSYETESFICAPILNRGRLVGVLNLTEKKSKRPFQQTDLDTLMLILDQFSASLEQAINQRHLHNKNRKLSAAIKKATAKLRHSKTQLSFAEAFNAAVVDNIPLGVVILDERCTIRLANKSFRDLFSERGKEIAGCPFSEALSSVSPEGRQLWEARMQSAFRNEAVGTAQLVCPMAQGARSVFNINTRLFSSPGRPKEKLLLVIIEDVTDDVTMKARVARAQRLAEMGELVAGVAHEINNPLDGIMRFTNIAVKRANGDEFLQDCFTETKRGLERISRIVKSLMQYTRNCRKAFTETDVNELLDNILVLMAYMQTKRNIRVERKFDPRLPRISARSNLDQVFINLIKNGFESMNDGGEMEIETRSQGEELFIQFKDNGCGIAPDVLSKLGESFVTTKENGTGLGLNICQEIIKQHKGELTVESEVGVGSVFTVRLPLNQQMEGRNSGREK